MVRHDKEVQGCVGKARPVVGRVRQGHRKVRHGKGKLGKAKGGKEEKGKAKMWRDW